MRSGRSAVGPGRIRKYLLVAVAASVVAGGAASSARATPSSIPDQTYVTNGVVNAIAVDPTSGTAYLGGVFTQVGPRTGPGVGLDASTGGDLGLPQVSGVTQPLLGDPQTIHAVAPDGSGGWYIGGNFTHVGGVARSDIAHIQSDGTVDPSFNPSADGEVDALAVSGATVYAGGQFANIGGAARSFLAALNGSTGVATSWAPQPDMQVRTLAVGSSVIFVGGDFTTIGATPQTRTHLAAIDSSGDATSWAPNPDSSVRALALTGSTLYVGGAFTTIGATPQTRHYLAAVDTSNGDASSWSPEPNGGVQALAVSGSTVYAGGVFGRIGTGDDLRPGLAALDASTGAATAWDPNPGNGTDLTGISALAVSGSTVYVGGSFTTLGSAERNHIAAIDAGGTGTPQAWNPDVNGDVLAIAVAGGTVYAGGDFTSDEDTDRHNLAAIDASGAVTSWNPGANAEIDTMALSGSTVYVGGTFTIIGANSQPRNSLAALDSSTGDATTWNPAPDDRIWTIAVSGSTIYVGGDFNTIGANALTRHHIAALDAATGDASTSWHPDANNFVYALAVSGSTVYAGGVFNDGGTPQTTIGGADRNYIAALDATTGNATSWNPDSDGLMDGQVETIAVSGSTVYAGGLFSHIGGAARLRIAALDSSGVATAFDPSSNDEVEAIAVSGSTVYATGSFTLIGGSSRNQLAALDASTGTATSWDPDPNVVGGDGGEAIAVTSNSVLVGGIWNGYDSAPQQGIARFSEPSSSPTVTELVPTSGVSVGGTSVKVTGTNLTGATAVKFGTNTSTFTVDSSTQITATAPAGSGTVDVTVTTPGGTSLTGAADRFRYIPPPSVSIVAPADGATYNEGDVVDASYSCTEGAGGPGLTSCIGDLPNGSPIDTSQLGSHSFSVTATSIDGQATMSTSHYMVVGPATYVVTTTADSGAGSLRQAILNSNGNPYTNTIRFAIASGPQTISPTSTLPVITNPAVIDATTQPGYGGTPLIRLDGASAGTGTNGLVISAGGSTVEGLSITGWSGNGIELNTSGGDTIAGDYVGLGPDGTTGFGNSVGIQVDPSAPNTMIGGTAAGTRNVISGNVVDGIGLLSGGNVVEGNYVGTDAMGANAVANHQNGLEVEGASGNTIGGTSAGARNVISGNDLDGVKLDTSSAPLDTVIEGNYIGTNASGTAKIGNGDGGVEMANTTGNTVGGVTAGARNVISGNRFGIQLTAGNVAEGNYIGTDASGTAKLGNVGGGVVSGGGTIGGTASGARNVISGNGGDGVFVTSGVVEGNYIGVDATGSAALGNGFAGVEADGADTTVGGITGGAGNVIAGNAGDGVDVGFGLPGSSTAERILVEGNYIGTDASGTQKVGNSGAGIAFRVTASSDVVGGTATGAGNVISGNARDGVDIAFGAGGLVEGNYIGTDATGAAALGNGGSGVVAQGNLPGGTQSQTIGGTTSGARNVISGNVGDGVDSTFGYGVLVEGNYIGTNASGTGALGNTNGVVSVVSTIGGTAAGAGNLISGNRSDGVFAPYAPTNPSPGPPGNVIMGDIIGLNAAGTAALPNVKDGIELAGTKNTTIGGTAAGVRNVISGNGTGIEISASQSAASGNVIAGDYIGTNLSGSSAVPNGTGVTIDSGATGNTVGGGGSGAGNVISGNATGVHIDASSANLVQGNFIGTTAGGNAPLGNSGAGVLLTGGAANNTVGGTTNAAGNVISASATGVHLTGGATSSNLLEGNFIGTDRSGSVKLQNNTGVALDGGASGNTIGGTAAGDRNLISGNSSNGVTISGAGTTGNQVQGNYVGTDSTGTKPIGNFLDGVLVSAGATGNTIGGSATGAGNLVANNLKGVEIFGSASIGDPILGNSIFANTGKLGIALTVGGNGSEPPPKVSSLTNVGTQTTIAGTVTAGGHRIELFVNPGCSDPEGRRFLGSLVTATATWSLKVPKLGAGQGVTATATRTSSSNTSQFSACRATAGAATLTSSTATVSGSTASITLSCNANGPCVGSVLITPVAGAAAAAARRASAVLARGKYSIRAGRHAVVKLHLSARGKVALRTHGGKLRAILELIPTNASPSSSRITLRMKKTR